MNGPLAELSAAVTSRDADAVRIALDRHPDLRATLDAPMPGGSFGQTALMVAVNNQDRPTIDALLQAGADINARSHWWAGSFGVLDGAEPSLAAFLVERGARIDAHSAARLGMREALEKMLTERPAVVHARGGDGQMPLHFASTVEIAELLISRGAEIDARDIDHESSPAQWMVRDRQDVARFLVARGCRTDILMASALGDFGLVRRHLDADPASIRTRVSETFFPKQNPRSGGSIYIWTLGADKTAHAIAREFGHPDILAELVERSPATLRLMVAARAGDEAAVQQLIASDPTLVSQLTDEDRRALPDAARDDDIDAVRVMLAAGWPVDARGQHRATSLHWAGWNGNEAIARELLRYGAPTDVKGDEYDGTPLNWTIYGSVHGWRCRTGNYAGTAETLIAAGSPVPALTPQLEASAPVRAVLERHAPR